MGEPLSIRSWLGVGLEPVSGTQALAPVKSQVELDTLSDSLEGNQEVIEVPILNGGRAHKKVVLGAYSSGGDLNFAVTPDKCTKILYACLRALTANTATTGAIAHVFKPEYTLNNTLLHPLTVQKQRGDSFLIYPNQYVTRLVLRCDTEGILTATATLEGAGPNATEREYATEQSDVGIAASALDPFVFHEAAVSLGGSSNSDTGNWEITIEMGTRSRRTLSGGRAPSRIAPGKVKVTGTFDIVFADSDQYRKWLATTSTQDPRTLGDSVVTQAAQIVYTSGSKLFQVDIPDMYYLGASGIEVEDPETGFVTQRCQFAAQYDISSSSHVTVTVTNTEQDTDITTVGTPI